MCNKTISASPAVVLKKTEKESHLLSELLAHLLKYKVKLCNKVIYLTNCRHLCCIYNNNFFSPLCNEVIG